MSFYDLSHPQKERNGLKQMHLYPSPPPSPGSRTNVARGMAKDRSEPCIIKWLHETLLPNLVPRRPWGRG